VSFPAVNASGSCTANESCSIKNQRDQNVSDRPSHRGGNAKRRFCFIGTTPTENRWSHVPMKGNNMTNQNQPGQQNQAPGQKPGPQQGGGQKPGQQSQTPGKDTKEPHKQTSNTDT